MTFDRPTATRFVCPLCGSHYFRTDPVSGDPRVAMGRCKGREVVTPRGRDYVGCDYFWPRSEDECVFAPEETDA